MSNDNEGFPPIIVVPPDPFLTKVRLVSMKITDSTPEEEKAQEVMDNMVLEIRLWSDEHQQEWAAACSIARYTPPFAVVNLLYRMIKYIQDQFLPPPPGEEVIEPSALN